MTNERIFNYETKAVEFVDEEGKAEALIAAGNAKKLEIPELDKFEGSADKIHDEFLAARQRILDSDNPAHTDDVKSYEIAKLTEAFEEESAAIEQEYSEWKTQQVKDARQRKATAVVNVSQADKGVVEQWADRALLDLSMSGADDVGVLLGSLTEDISYMTDSQKTALLSRLPGLMAGIEGEDVRKRALVSAVKDVRSADLNALNVANGLPVSVLTKKRQYDVLSGIRKGGL